MNDDLMMIWREGASEEPNYREVTRLAGRATVAGFDRVISWRNFREYAAGFAVMAVFGTLAIKGHSPWQNVIACACVGFVMAFIWWNHRNMTQPDPAADARTYQAAMVDRLDRQIRLLRSMRYWYLLPLFVPPLMQLLQLGKKRGWLPAAIGLLIVTAIYIGLAYLNERVGVNRLLEQRKRIIHLCGEDA